MSRKPLIQTRVERDTKESIDQYTETLGEDVSQSEAIRHLLRAGLAQKGHPVAGPTDQDGGTRYLPDSLLERLASPLTVLTGAVILIMGAGLMATAGLFATSGTLLYALVGLGASTVLLVVAAGTIAAATLAQLALARPLRGLVGLSTEVKA